MGLVIVTAPALEPLTTAEAKTHIRVSTSGDDTYIDLLVKRARVWVEDVTGRALVNQTWDLKMDGFPTGLNGERFQDSIVASREDELRMPKAPLVSVTSITYTDTNGDAQTWGSTLYTVDTTREPGRIVPAYSETWPNTRAHINVVTVRFVAGYGATAADVQEPLRHAIGLLCGTWYEFRTEVISGTIIADVPEAVDRLIAPYVLVEVV